MRGSLVLHQEGFLTSNWNRLVMQIKQAFYSPSQNTSPIFLLQNLSSTRTQEIIQPNFLAKTQFSMTNVVRGLHDGPFHHHQLSLSTFLTELKPCPL